MKWLVKLYLSIESIYDKKLSAKVVTFFTIGLSFLALIVLFVVGVRRASELKAEDSKKIEVQKTVNKEPWVSSDKSIDESVWSSLEINTNSETVKRYATMIAGVMDNDTRMIAYNSIPWYDSKVSEPLSTPFEVRYYDMPKTLTLKSYGKTYGSSSESYMFVFDSTWSSSEGVNFEAIEIVNITMKDGKVVSYSHNIGKGV